MRSLASIGRKVDESYIHFIYSFSPPTQPRFARPTTNNSSAFAAPHPHSPHSNSRLIDNLYRTTIKINNNEYPLTATKESLQPYLSGGSKHTSLSGGDNGDDSIYKSASEVKGVILITDDPTLSPSEICTGEKN